jgi:hypothetical protein
MPRRMSRAQIANGRGGGRRHGSVAQVASSNERRWSYVPAWTESNRRVSAK